MNPVKLLAIVLIVLGAAGLAYGGFSYTRDTQTAEIGPLEITVTDRRRVQVPIWAGVVAIVIGTGLLLVPARSLKNAVRS
jgi:hypothetical protein